MILPLLIIVIGLFTGTLVISMEHPLVDIMKLIVLLLISLPFVYLFDKRVSKIKGFKILKEQNNNCLKCDKVIDSDFVLIEHKYVICPICHIGCSNDYMKLRM